MLGHAIDFFIPGVPLDKIRAAGLRLQRGGVGFYPTSGSPFVHLDTGTIRHWPRMTHDQLVRVFPNERTVHVPSDGVPLRGYDLALADIEKRGDDSVALAGAKPAGSSGFLSALFKSGSHDDDDSESALSPAPAPAPAARAAVKPPPAKPDGPHSPATTVASAARSATGAGPRAQPVTAANNVSVAAATPGHAAATPAQAATTPGQAAALGARRMLAQVAPAQPPASGQTSNALAYAAETPHQRTLPAAAAPKPVRVAADNHTMTRGLRIKAQGDSPDEASDIVEDEAQPHSSHVVVRNARLTMARSTSAWLRVVTLAPSATNAMQLKAMGNADNVGGLRGYFIKPRAVIANSFGSDPMPGMSFDSFSGSAFARLEITSF